MQRREKLFDVPAADDKIRRPAVESALQSVLHPETAAIVASYVKEKSYVWTDRPYMAPVTIVDNQVISRRAIMPNIDEWIGIVATTAIGDGPRRWRILTDFYSDEPGLIGIGVSKTTSIACSTRNGARWMHASTADDVFISTAEPPETDHDYHKSEIFAGGRGFFAGCLRSNTKQAITLVEVADDRRRITFTFQSADAGIRDVIVSLPTAAAWRPSIVLSGAVAATILDWPDDA